MISAQIIAPTLEPELKMPVASARSFFGNHSATVLIDAGKLPASPAPKRPRAASCAPRLFPAAALKNPAIDHTIREAARHLFVPTLSMIKPTISVNPAWNAVNTDVRME